MPQPPKNPNKTKHFINGMFSDLPQKKSKEVSLPQKKKTTQTNKLINQNKICLFLIKLIGGQGGLVAWIPGIYHIVLLKPPPPHKKKNIPRQPLPPNLLHFGPCQVELVSLKFQGGRILHLGCQGGNGLS